MFHFIFKNQPLYIFYKFQSYLYFFFFLLFSIVLFCIKLRQYFCNDFNNANIAYFLDTRQSNICSNDLYVVFSRKICCQRQLIMQKRDICFWFSV
jgi:hypothetical protein